MPYPLAFCSIWLLLKLACDFTPLIIAVSKIIPMPMPINSFLSLKKLINAFILNIIALLIVLPPYPYLVFGKSPQ